MADLAAVGALLQDMDNLILPVLLGWSSELHA